MIRITTHRGRGEVRAILLSLLCSLFLLQGCATRKSKESEPRRATSAPLREVVSPIAQKSVVIPFKYSKEPEIRGVWLTTIYGLDWPHAPATTRDAMRKQREELCQILDRLASANFNTVFFQVRLRGDLLYSSDIEPMASILTGKSGFTHLDYDPLAFAVEECHKRGLTLHAWIVTLPIGTDKHVKSLGNRGVWGRHRSWCISHKGEWYLDPGLPEVRQYIASLSKDLVKRYDVDGIHFDYIRYPEHASSFKDQASYLKYGKGKEKNVWRVENISSLLREVAQDIRSLKPHVLISAATLGKFRTLPDYPKVGWTCRESVFQDPIRWHKEGSIDFIVPMMYYKDHLFDPFLFDWKKQIPSLPIVAGLGVYRVDDNSRWHPTTIAQQIKLSTEQKMAGVCFYREENIRPRRKGVDQIIARHFASPVRMYPFKSRALETPPAPTNLLLTRLNEKKVQISWEIADQFKSATIYNLFLRKKSTTSSTEEDVLLVPLIYGNKVIVSSEMLQDADFLRVEALDRAFNIGGVSQPLYL
ncbi:glycoside hydrolase family 10 protein [Porphyromonas gingivicanis]|uniref:glycoside hydrolase family 10 protein n=1 Tax=Porphyromonas gingivicanis TaxID=266762 RepID=UPI00068B275B|nr:family 10 glycosylhydrolase [Porphyromonas gingivicanis]